ncbi:MAG: peptidoglycan DD-metalloendopeptidase family protein [Candidatus Firestonebacteria bacterium]|nr:peptidoglycan DD-metalloendopeptidase family protein [Candidatus Firestonebacteria bacterium]
MTPRRALVLTSALCACLAASAAGASPEPTATPSTSRKQLQHFRQNLQRGQQDLKTLQQQIHTEQQQVMLGRRQERSLLTDLQTMDKRIDGAEEHLAEDQRNLREVQTALSNIRAAMAQTQAAQEEMKGFLAVRLRLLYREGRQGFWRVLATSPSVSEAMRRLKFFHILASQNAYWIERLSLTRAKLAGQKADLAARERQARDLEASSLRTLESIRGQKKRREQMLDHVRNKREAHEAAARELSAAAENLNRLVDQLKRRAADLEKRIRLEGLAFPLRQKKLIWPTRGRVTQKFGRTRHPRFNTYVLNKGIDITGTMGQNVCAVAPGNVLFAEWFEGYGRLVILDHGRGFNTIYAHLAKISVSEGQTVAEGQSVGTLGDSGTWKGPNLYFEIRQRGQAVDPMDWMER